MRTRPLPNRHAADLSDFFETVQATLNRNRGKPPLDEMTYQEIISKAYEEYMELAEKILMYISQPQPATAQEIEREAADLAVCALSAKMWARRQGKA